MRNLGMAAIVAALMAGSAPIVRAQVQNPPPRPANPALHRREIRDRMEDRRDRREDVRDRRENVRDRRENVIDRREDRVLVIDASSALVTPCSTSERVRINSTYSRYCAVRRAIGMSRTLMFSLRIR